MEKTHHRRQRPKSRFKHEPEQQRKNADEPKPVVLATPIERGKLKITPLGGLGDKIGKNMMAIEYEEDIILVDCGFMFPGDDLPGIDYVIPDVSYLEHKKHRVRAMLITHGHEDHIGGLPYILPKFNVPVYGSRFSIGLVENKLEERGLASQAKLIVIDPDKREKLFFGKLSVEFFRVAHSIPDSNGLIIETPFGTIIHTGDFTIDHTPVFNWMKTDLARMGEIAKLKPLILMSDSTNAENPGSAPSQKVIEDSLQHAFTSAKGRIIIASFSSQVARTQQIFDQAKATGRKVALSGFSMLRYVELAVKQGLLKIPAGTVIKIADAPKYKDHELVILSTGAQGENMAQLMRMALGSHKVIKLKNGDLVILSASIIPGNENSVFRMIDSLYREGAEVLREGARGLSDIGHVHVSGHGNQEELKQIIDLVKPKFFMPIHGELHHLKAHANIAKLLGYTDDNIIVVENGHTVDFTKAGFKLGTKHPYEWILVDGLGVGDVQKVVLKDRQAMASDGIFAVILVVDKKTGAMLSSPDIISRGFIYMRESEDLINKARAEIRRLATKKEGKKPDWANVKNKIREEIGRFLYHKTKRRPMILPVIIEV